MVCKYFSEIENTQIFDDKLFQKEDCCESYKKLKERGEYLKNRHKMNYRIKGQWTKSKHHLVLWIH